MSAQRYPLTWPAGWKRHTVRHRARFAQDRSRLSVASALRRLDEELGRLGARDYLLSSDVRLRLDGQPRSDQPEPRDPGVALYFKLKNKPHALASDRWDRVADNIAALAAHVYALRAIERYGVGTTEQAFAGYQALPPTSADWWLVLGVRQDASLLEVEEAFRRLSKAAHPDAGGSHDEMAKLTEARANARKAIG